MGGVCWSISLSRSPPPAIALVCMLGAGVATSQEPADDPEEKDEPSPFDKGILAFGDIYTVPGNHLPEADGDVGAWIRRIYVTGDYTWSSKLFTRLRIEANQEGDFLGHAITADFKDVFLRWSIGRHDLIFGLSFTPTFDLVEEVWGYRHLERTPLDVQGEPSRDTGVAAHGPLNESGRLRYRAMWGTGAEFGRETGEGNKFMGAVSLGGDRGWLFDVYGDFQELPEATDKTTFQIFTAHRGERSRFGFLYHYQDREEDPRLELASAFGVVDLSPSTRLIGRVDRLFAPSPKGNDIDYLPFDPTTEATLLIAALEFRVHRYLSLIPNVEVILYDDPETGETPKNDFFIRLTVYFHY